MTRLVNKRELSELMDISERALTDWQSEGMPIAQIAERRGQEQLYSVPAVIEWRIQRAIAKAQIETPRDRLDRVRAEREELALARDRRDLVQISELREAFDAWVYEVIGDLDRVPERYALALQNTADVEGKRQVLVTAVEDIRRIFARDPSSQIATGDAAAVLAATETLAG